MTREKNNISGRQVSSKGCFHCGKEDHQTLKCPERLAKVICGSCNAKGHYASDCVNNRAMGRPGACFRCGLYGHQRRFCVTLECDFEDIIEIPQEEDERMTGSNESNRSTANLNSTGSSE